MIGLKSATPIPAVARLAMYGVEAFRLMGAAAQLWRGWYCRARLFGSVGLRWRRIDVNGGRSAGIVASARRGGVGPTDTRTCIFHASGHVLADHSAPSGGPRSSDIAADKPPLFLHCGTIYVRRSQQIPQRATVLLSWAPKTM